MGGGGHVGLPLGLAFAQAQLNVVLKQGFYPRSLTGAPHTDADHRVLRAYAGERAYHPEQRIEARVQSVIEQRTRDAE